MTGRRPTDAGAAGPLTGPNTVSPFRPERSSPPRRPLGASLSPADRLVAYEARIRELGHAIERLTDGVEHYETATTVAGIDRAWSEIHHAWLELVEVHGRPFRRPARAPVIRIRR